ncbi:MAG: 4-hydroxy-3-methylbut-2-enyl diphosphate reductase [Kiritimatiellae bacterium]|nr:4-hydroxy-3-methylbut-2-enyl diphosphate reductase [Kiritimatiellia bacterium]
MNKRIIVVEPHGFCSGVARAVETAEKVVAKNPGEPVYCLNQIVHNQQVVGQLKKCGMIFVTSVTDVSEGALLLLSAHGVSPEVKRSAAARNLKVVDAVCPFVSKVHAEVRNFARQGVAVVCIGHRSHEEVIGVVGEAPDVVQVVESADEVQALDISASCEVGVVTQTTLGVAQVDSVMEALKQRWPDLKTPKSTDVCYATRNRQRAVQELAGCCGRVLVLGSTNSSNSRRLVECSEAEGTESILISELNDLDQLNWDQVDSVGITSGASTPEVFLDTVVQALQGKWGFDQPEIMTAVEELSPHFLLPEVMGER